MAQEDIVGRIRQAEQEAAAIREQGQARAREEQRAAAQQAEDERGELTRELRQQAKEQTDAAYAQAQARTQGEIDRHAQQLDAAGDSASMHSVVQMVLERIVKG